MCYWKGRDCLVEKNEILNDIISGVLADYFNEFDVEPFPVTISIVDDMWNAYAKLRPDHAEKQPEMAEFQRSCSGSAVPPKEFDGAFTILLQKEYMMESVQNNANWVGTLVHEATHVNDFIQFGKMIKATNYDDVLDRNNYRMFHLWTEFHAKVIGYYFVRKYTFKDLQDESQIKYIFETELPFQINEMFEAYHSTTDGDQQMYYVVHFIGRMYVWQKLFPKYFTNRQIKKMFDANKWMYELYIFLASHDKLDIAFPDFDDMKNILKQNFSGLD